MTLDTDHFAGTHATVGEDGLPTQFQVFYASADQIGTKADDQTEITLEGWHWWSIEDGLVTYNVTGPFPTDEGAFLNALGD